MFPQIPQSFWPIALPALLFPTNPVENSFSYECVIILKPGEAQQSHETFEEQYSWAPAPNSPGEKAWSVATCSLEMSHTLLASLCYTKFM